MGWRLVVIVALVATGCVTRDWHTRAPAALDDKRSPETDEPPRYLVTTSIEAMEIDVDKADAQALHGELLRKWTLMPGVAPNLAWSNPDTLAHENRWHREPVAVNQHVDIERVDIVFALQKDPTPSDRQRKNELYAGLGIGAIVLLGGLFLLAYLH